MLFFILYSKTPIEILHTILLGPVKYLLSATIQSLSRQKKDQLHANILSTDMSAFPANIRGNITRNYGSYVGRDFKLWTQLAVFILQGIVSEEILLVWELLSEVPYCIIPYHTIPCNNLICIFFNKHLKSHHDKKFIIRLQVFNPVIPIH